jgi:hypothetical protein
MTRFENSDCGEGAKTGAKSRTADLKQLGQITFGGETLSRFQLSLLNEFSKVVQNLFGRTPVS